VRDLGINVETRLDALVDTAGAAGDLEKTLDIKAGGPTLPSKSTGRNML
jgi:hypothetical protein